MITTSSVSPLTMKVQFLSLATVSITDLKFFRASLKLTMLTPHFSQRKRMECLKALPSIDLNPILAQLPQRQCVVRM
jgi:hypothetical protein